MRTLASVNGDSDDDRYDIVGCGAAGQPATGPLRSEDKDALLENYHDGRSLLLVTIIDVAQQFGLNKS